MAFCLVCEEFCMYNLYFIVPGVLHNIIVIIKLYIYIYIILGLHIYIPLIPYYILLKYKLITNWI